MFLKSNFLPLLALPLNPFITARINAHKGKTTCTIKISAPKLPITLTSGENSLKLQAGQDLASVPAVNSNYTEKKFLGEFELATADFSCGEISCLLWMKSVGSLYH